MNDNRDILSVTIDNNLKTFKPILFSTYESITKYNIHINYEDESVKDIELVQCDKDRLYTFTFKHNGKLITKTGVPKIHEINECNKMCDFVNKIMDSNDLLIELDCSGEYECSKVRFYLKDVRDIIDLANEPIENPDKDDDNIKHTIYPIYLNNHSCKDIISCKVTEEDGIFSTVLSSQIMKSEKPLSKEDYSDFDIFAFDFDPIVSSIETSEDELIEKVKLVIPEELLDTEITLIVRYFINEINHPVFDEFTIIPSKNIKEDTDDSDITVLTHAVSTQDMQYLGDGLKPALGVGMTPSYKEYRRKKSYNNSVFDK